MDTNTTFSRTRQIMTFCGLVVVPGGLLLMRYGGTFIPTGIGIALTIAGAVGGLVSLAYLYVLERRLLRRQDSSHSQTETTRPLDDAGKAIPVWSAALVIVAIAIIAIIGVARGL